MEALTIILHMLYAENWKHKRAQSPVFPWLKMLLFQCAFRIPLAIVREENALIFVDSF